MATKKIICPGETGLTVYCIARRESDGYRLNDADGAFASNPADPYLSLTEDTVIKGLYEVSEARTVWDDERYTFTFYSQAGGSPAPVSDAVIGSGEMYVKDDTEVVLDVNPSTRLPANDARLDNLDAAVSSRLAAADYTAPYNAGIETLESASAFLVACITNAKDILKEGAVWYLVIYDGAGPGVLLKKPLKDMNGNNITDLKAGSLAKELASIV